MEKCFTLLFLLSSTEPEHSINIPSYIVRGAGKQTHVEYEIRIFLADDRWLLLRRYSRFRDLHLNMKAFYGDKVSNDSISFESDFNLQPLEPHRSLRLLSQNVNCLHQTVKMWPKRDAVNWKLISVDCLLSARGYP
jgi:hypothetical protein